MGEDGLEVEVLWLFESMTITMRVIMIIKDGCVVDLQNLWCFVTREIPYQAVSPSVKGDKFLGSEKI